MQKGNLIKPSFLIIPKQVYEDPLLQPHDWAVYAAVYWFEHLKDGKCTAGNDRIAEVINAKNRTVQNGLLRLEARGYIQRIFKDDSKRTRLEIQTLVDYEVRNAGDTSERYATVGIQVRNAGDTQVRNAGGQKKKDIKKEKKEGNTATANVAGSKSTFNPLGAEIIKAFEGVDAKNKTYYSNKTQRAACDFLIAEYGLEDVKKRISVLPKTNKLSYFPTITTPYELKEKWVKLEDAVARKRSEENKPSRDKPNYIL